MKNYNLLISVFCVICFLILGCSSTPKKYTPLDEAKLIQSQLLNDENFQQNASVALFQAEEYLKNAKLALDDGDLSSVDHLIYMARRKQDIANELVLKALNEQEISSLELQQQEMIALVRQSESDRAQEAQQKIERLEQTIGEYRAEETSRGTLLVINDLLFDSGGSTLTQESGKRLQPLVLYLSGNSQREVIIEGHTDSHGNEKSNKQLSLRRAEAVKKHLVHQGIDGTRIETRGFGSEVPVASNTTNAGRKLNRRVEIVIKSLKDSTID